MQLRSPLESANSFTDEFPNSRLGDVPSARTVYGGMTLVDPTTGLPGAKCGIPRIAWISAGLGPLPVIRAWTSCEPEVVAGGGMHRWWLA